MRTLSSPHPLPRNTPAARSTSAIHPLPRNTPAARSTRRGLGRRRMDLLEPDEDFPFNCLDRAGSPHRDLRALHAIAQVLAAGSGQEELLLRILEILESELGMTRGTVMLLSP